jgi:hypothetical protein
MELSDQAFCPINNGELRVIHREGKKQTVVRFFKQNKKDKKLISCITAYVNMLLEDENAKNR